MYITFLYIEKISSVTCAKVYTLSYARSPTRVGLTFERVALKQQEILGYKIPGIYNIVYSYLHIYIYGSVATFVYA